MFAMLLEMTWTLSSWAIIPVAAVCNARMTYLSLGLGRNFGEALDRVAAHIVLLLQDVGDFGIGARQFDHARHLDDRAHVRFLDRALHDADVDRGLRLNAVGRPKRAG